MLCMAFACCAQQQPGSTPQPTPPPQQESQPKQEPQPQQEQPKQPGSTPAPVPPQQEPQPKQELPAPFPATSTEIVITAVGDVMLGSTFPDATGGDLPPHDGADVLHEVTPLLQRGDVVFGNLEGPLMDSGESRKCKGKREGTCYAFRVPTRYGRHLKAAGFTVMGLANNHALDFGPEGRVSSRHALEEQGIAHSGDIGDIAHLDAKGKRVAVISFATYPGAYNFLDLEDALVTITAASKEADMVIVTFHGGAEGVTHQHVPQGEEEFLGENRGDLRRFTHAAIDAGAQLLLGSGPHVVRGMEIYKGRLIAYSLGNFATYGSFNMSGETGLSTILEAHLGSDGTFLGGCAYPLKQEKPGGPKIDPAMHILPVLRSLSQTDFGASAVQVGTHGELMSPTGISPAVTCDLPKTDDQKPAETGPVEMNQEKK
jgi:hypothetical protein